MIQNIVVTILIILSGLLALAPLIVIPMLIPLIGENWPMFSRFQKMVIIVASFGTTILSFFSFYIISGFFL